MQARSIFVLFICVILTQVSASVASQLPTTGYADLLPVPNCNKVAMLKSLKTGSTTFASILFRVAAAHGLRVFRQEEHDASVNYTLPPMRQGAADVVLSHIRGGCIARGEWPRLMSFYEEVSCWRAVRGEVGPCTLLKPRQQVRAALVNLPA